MEKEILRLFKGYLSNEADWTVNEKALKYGLVIPKSASDTVVDAAINMYGKDGEKWNQTFHKSFNTIKEVPIETLIAQQVLHYFTTYGLESIGVYNSDLVYIPSEKLEIPELDKDIEMIVIQPLNKEMLCEKLMVLLTSGIALSRQTISDVMTLSDFLDKDRFDEIKNREVKIALYDKYNIVPKDPDEFLRYLIFKTTGETLKIKNKELYNMICGCNKEEAYELLRLYLSQSIDGYTKLSSIFLRNKMLFLAFKISNSTHYYKKCGKQMNLIINRLRKLANKTHKPLKKNILDCLTDRNMTINLDELVSALDNVTIFRELRILNGIRYRLHGSNNIVYKIRNGKSYTKELKERDMIYVGKLSNIHDVVLTHIINRVKKNVKDKYICIPNNVKYAIPTSEKQFNGNFPNGSYIEIPRDSDLIYGVYWKNLDNERVDLDLKQMNKSEVFGWDASYRSSNGNILFSGDMTSAPLPQGASELFYVGKDYKQGAFLVSLNMFTGNSKNVPFEFVIAKADKQLEYEKRYVLDPNNILHKFDMEINNHERQMILGLISIDENIRFYLSDFTQGINVRSSSRNKYTIGAYDYLKSYFGIQLTLNDLLLACGANIVTNPIRIVQKLELVDAKEMLIDKEVPVDIDLSPNAITKETIINLLS